MAAGETVRSCVMPIQLDATVMLPGFRPYPRYGRVTQQVDEDRVLGLVSIGDVVKALLHEQQFVINQLERYIRA